MKYSRHLWLIVLMMLVVGLTGMITKVEAAYPVSTDPMRVKQTYLDMIHIDQAWAAAGDSRTPIVVAVVDTGVDLVHPDLVGNLVDGVNLLQPSKKPQDDNGHGTNVAGIIAASFNNDKGIAGIAPNAKIMPIKALEADGTGGEAKLGEGIKYAVDHGAKIVVLSLGLNKYSDYMEGIVQYAEDRNVLLVAAVGNESTSVKYPAAYPTVLAVGGVNSESLLTLVRILGRNWILWHPGMYTQLRLGAAISTKMEAPCLRLRLQQLRLWCGANTRV